jgi:hypothetical protein
VTPADRRRHLWRVVQKLSRASLKLGC